MVARTNRLVVLALIGLLLAGTAGPVAAHETQSVDGYDITFGGAAEPLITGERMWLEFEIVDNETGEPVTGQADSLNAAVQIEGHDRGELTLGEKHGEDGVYEAPVVFTEPGEYVVHLEGSIEDTEVHTHFEKEVRDRAELEYPANGSRTADGDSETQSANRPSEAGFGAGGVAAVGIGLVGVAGAALVRRRR